MPDTKKKEGEIPLVILGCAINVFKWNSLLSPRAPWMDLYQNQHKGKMLHSPPVISKVTLMFLLWFCLPQTVFKIACDFRSADD